MADLIRAGVNLDQLEFPYPIPIITKTTHKGLIEIIFTKPLTKIDPGINLRTLEYKNETGVYVPALSIAIEPYPMQEH